MMVKRKRPLGALGGVVLIATIGVMVAVFLTPVLAPQATCDALAPLLGCKGGATPSCTMTSSGSGRRSGQNVAVRCPEGGGSAAPIYITAVTVALISLGAGMGFLIAHARRRRRREESAHRARRRTAPRTQRAPRTARAAGFRWQGRGARNVEQESRHPHARMLPGSKV